MYACVSYTVNTHYTLGVCTGERREKKNTRKKKTVPQVPGVPLAPLPCTSAPVVLLLARRAVCVPSERARYHLPNAVYGK